MNDKTGRENWMTAAEFAALLRVDIRTVAHWDRDGRFPAGTLIRTAGGHRRVSRQYAADLLAQDGATS